MPRFILTTRTPEHGGNDREHDRPTEEKEATDHRDSNTPEEQRDAQRERLTRVALAERAQLPRNHRHQQKLHADRQREPAVEIPIATLESHDREAESLHRAKDARFLGTARDMWRGRA